MKETDARVCSPVAAVHDLFDTAASTPQRRRPRSGAPCPSVIAPTGVWSPGTPNSARNGSTRSAGMPKKHAARPSSTAVSSISSDAIPVSTYQYGTDQTCSSGTMPPLSASA